jgi:NAD(P)H dehydrogenase (quinone)
MKIGVSGASGKLGQGVVAELVKRGGHEVVAISRTPDKAAAGAQGRFGDYDRPESLAQAYAGLDRLLLIPTSEMARGRRGAQNLAAIDAAVQAGVGHVVFMSAVGTRREEEPSVGASYWQGEQRLIATAPKWSILRMNYYAEALAQEAQMSAGQRVLTGFAENRVAFVARDDVAAAAAGLLAGEGHEGAIYNATGPERLSAAERAALIAEVTGKPMGFVTITEEQLRGGMAQMGLPEDVANAVASIQASFAAGAFDIVTGDVERLSGRAPKPLRDVFAAVLR